MRAAVFLQVVDIALGARDPVVIVSPRRRSADNISARCAIRTSLARKKPAKKQTARSVETLFLSPKKQNEYVGYRQITPDRPTSSLPILIGAVVIAAAILLSALVTTLGTRFVGIEGATEENVWLVDRLTGIVYKCQAAERGKASCEVEIATGSIGGKR